MKINNDVVMKMMMIMLINIQGVDLARGMPPP